jgi:hypothetical protein
VDRNILNLQELGAKREADLHLHQKVYLLALRTTVLPQLLLLIKKKKEEADRTVINCLRRATKRANKKRKLDEIEQNEEREVEE